MRFQSNPVAEHEDVPAADDGRLQDVVEKWSGSPQRGEGIRSYVVSVGNFASEIERGARLREILGLVEARGDVLVGHESLRVVRPHPRTYFGKGTCEAIGARARAVDASLVVVDAHLSPSQMRDLEDAIGVSVADREGVILGVFLAHATSKQAKIQVQIAKLEYLRPRIRGLGLDMDQQAGGVMNGRGAGETASELLARQLDDRLSRLRKQLRRIDNGGKRQRATRQGCARIALVGYTNAGKTTLMNGLCGSSLSTRSRPFETLDTTTRCLTRYGGDVLIGDTVGFIRDLPERLLASFSSTLAEAREATLVVVVVDLSDPEWRLHLHTTDVQLRRAKVDATRFVVFNKVDAGGSVSSSDLAGEASPWPNVVVSALNLRDVDALRDRLVVAARGSTHVRHQLFVPYEALEVSVAIYRDCRVLESVATTGGLLLTVEGPVQQMEAIVASLGGEA